MADKGTPVVAAAAGTIRLVNWTARSHLDPERCCSVVVDHDDGWQSKYLHLTDDSPGTDDGKGWGIAAGIVPGTEIAAGQLLGWVGDSGNAESTVLHLHFELLDSKGIHVNAFEALLLAGGNPPPSPWGRLARVGVLRPGQEGQAITLLQEVLSELSYDVGPVDGIFGSKTAGGVRAYQSDRGLSVDGIVGTETFGELAADGSLEPAVLGLGSSGPQVAGMQGILTDLGFEPGPVDGVFGHRTLVAVLSFQRALNLQIDGLVGPQTLRALRGR